MERDFLAASRDYADRELAEETARADRQARARRRLRRRARRRGQPAPGRLRRHVGGREPPAGRVRHRPAGPGAPAGRARAGHPRPGPVATAGGAGGAHPRRLGDPRRPARGAGPQPAGAASGTRRQQPGGNDRTRGAHPGRLDLGRHRRQRRVRPRVHLEPGNAGADRRADHARPAHRGDHPGTRPVRRLHLGGHRLHDRLPGTHLLGRPRQADPGHLSAASGHHRLNPTDRPVHGSASAGCSDTEPATAALRPVHRSAAGPPAAARTRRAMSGRSGHC